MEAIETGRFGPVYRAREDATGLFVAIKVFDQGLTIDQAARLATALQRLSEAPLNHPAIVPILTAETVSERVWLAEPWFDATPLDAIMQREATRPLGDVLVLLTHVAAALDFAAAVGIYHGALHPRDVLAGADQTVLAGLGVLQALGEAGLAVPMEGAYVSPQRARGLAVSAADDIFSVAAIAYELIYGVPVPPRSELRAAVARPAGIDHTRLADLLDRALSPEPDERPASALAFAAALQETVTAIPIPILDSDSEVRAGTVPPRDTEIPIRDVDSRSAVSIPIHDSPPAADVADLPLRASEVNVASEPPTARQTRTVLFESESASPTARRESETESGYWFPVTATLAIGLLMGFVGGYVVGQRDATPVPYTAERPVARDQSAGTAGRDFTESIVPPAPSDVEPPARAEPLGNPPPELSRTDRTGSAAQETAERRSGAAEPGVLHVDSRPRGARVFIDGRLVGMTPVVVSDVRPGAHAVRIDLIGHRRWVTSVDVAPGERHRVAASLER